MSDNKGPSHRVYVMDDDDAPFNLGSVFPHADGKGCNVVLEASPYERELVLWTIASNVPAKFTERDWDRTPAFHAYSLLPRKGEKGEDDKFWLRIGSVFEAKSRDGLKIVLRAIPSDLKIVLREIKEELPRKTKR